MLNKVFIIGRLGREPEVRYTQNGTAICNFTVATDETITMNGEKQQKTEWHRIVVFNRAAENCQKYLGKGSLVLVEGKLQTRKWQDQNGQEKFTTEIIANHVQFLDRRNVDNNEEGPHYQQQSTAQPVPHVTSAEASQPNPFFNPNDDMPF